MSPDTSQLGWFQVVQTVLMVGIIPAFRILLKKTIPDAASVKLLREAVISMREAIKEMRGDFKDLRNDTKDDIKQMRTDLTANKTATEVVSSHVATAEAEIGKLRERTHRHGNDIVRAHARIDELSDAVKSLRLPGDPR